MLVLVYVGAVMVLFLFVVMMLDIKVEEHAPRLHALSPGSAGSPPPCDRGDRRASSPRGASASTSRAAHAPLPGAYSNTQELGRVLYTQYAYPFELAAMVLLVAIIAAIALTMRKRGGP